MMYSVRKSTQIGVSHRQQDRREDRNEDTLWDNKEGLKKMMKHQKEMEAMMTR